MKKSTIWAVVTGCLLSPSTLMAQNSSPYWSLGGNSNASSTSRLGTTNGTSLRFYTNNAQRMIINSGGLVGIGITSPTEKLHISSPSGTNALRAQINGSTKFLMHSNGGVTVGASTTPPSNGLYVSGKTGIGTSAPESKLHVLKGSAGPVVADLNSSLVVENSTHNYISVLAPDAAESGVLFGKPASNVSGGIIYSSGNDLQFRTNGNVTQMILDSKGNLGVGGPPGGFKTKIRHTCCTGFDIEYAPTGDDWEFFLVSGGHLSLFFNGLARGSFNSASGVYSPASDERLKTNLRPMGEMLEKIKLLKPSTYQFKNTTDKQDYNGFIAQDVMKIFPSMVTHNVSKERNLDVYTLDYSGFGVIAIKGIQELQPVIEQQKEKIATLEERIAKLEAALARITVNRNETGAINNALLEQNKPNPFNKNTSIHYSIPQGSKGQINIYDHGGKFIKAIKANENGQAELSAHNLAAGTYTYTLIINGRASLSKQMLVIK